SHRDTKRKRGGASRCRQGLRISRTRRGGRQIRGCDPKFECAHQCRGQQNEQGAPVSHCFEPTVPASSAGMNNTQRVAASPWKIQIGLLSAMPFSRKTEFPFKRPSSAGLHGHAYEPRG